jgi:2-polyprenyl-3-methyl-5-hydroxy-6-metoxy-1,4-benzoquinol methylase
MCSYPWGIIEEIISGPSGNIRVKGWAKQSELPVLEVCLNDKPILRHGVYRTYRPDVRDNLKVLECFQGFEQLYNLPSSGRLTVHIEGKKVVEMEVTVKPTHYPSLLSTEKVYHREDIYTYGPPVDDICEEVINIVKYFNDSVLDFGCGKGKTVQFLRNQGIKAYGIEINREAISETMVEEVKPYITLYDGILPVPYDNESFENIICVEVLEHIADYEKVVKELYRIARGKVIFTVPDIGAIPLCYHHGVVPWHLLEATHVNFFTLQSLQALLERYFKKVDMMKICPAQINDLRYYNNLLAVC